MIVTRYFAMVVTGNRTVRRIISHHSIGASGQWMPLDAIDVSHYEGPTQWLDNLLATWPEVKHAT